jgi:hypothetical protein
MNSTLKRPTWTLGDEIHPATFPASTLDPHACFRSALDTPRGAYRMNDVTTVMKAALGFAAETMRDAIAEIAFMARDAGPDTAIKGSSGWQGSWLPGPDASRIDMMMVHPDKCGAWHLSVAFKPVMTEAAAAREIELDALIEAEMEATGASRMDRMMAKMFPKGDGSANVQAMKRLNDDPASYRKAERGDALESLSGTALDLGAKGWNGVGPGGKPFGVEDFTQAKSFLPIKTYPKTWWSGMALNVRPVSSYQRHEGMLQSGGCESTASPEIPMEILSDLIRSNDLDGLVFARSDEASKKSWICFGGLSSAIMEEAAHAAVAAAGGFFDESVSSHIRDFSAGIAASDVSWQIEEWFEVVPRMIEKGMGDAKSPFDCNDGRDRAHALREDGVRSLQTTTQNGTYRIDMHEGEDGAFVAAEAFRMQGSERKVIGRFVMKEGKLVHDYGAAEDREAIPYTIRNVRDMNGLIGSLSSVACVFNDEHPKVDEDSPNP